MGIEKIEKGKLKKYLIYRRMKEIFFLKRRKYEIID